ncbi:hypothetical protein J2T60_001738 [Natronospira proteinivora]|uniref:Uncharacterized protein n=1 Tax=Natronospira proteinivora TaxID=1807133 RepID=A0ABT1G8T6_9GAMM|nr:hypothetical protein [Natronospira proteinivora]MCP1727738.1 hypothetical protein [Natronospira proteinivora]
MVSDVPNNKASVSPPDVGGSEDELASEENRVLEGEHKAVYRRDASGHYRMIPSEGWKVEEVVTTAAVAEFQRLAREARAAIQAGRASPLAFYMYERRLDPGSLAQAMGIMSWRVRRHLRPGPFSRLSPRLLRRYAEVLDMDTEQLKQEP